MHMHGMQDFLLAEPILSFSACTLGQAADQDIPSPADPWPVIKMACTLGEQSRVKGLICTFKLLTLTMLLVGKRSQTYSDHEPRRTYIFLSSY